MSHNFKALYLDYTIFIKAGVECNKNIKKEN